MPVAAETGNAWSLVRVTTAPARASRSGRELARAAVGAARRRREDDPAAPPQRAPSSRKSWPRSRQARGPGRRGTWPAPLDGLRRALLRPACELGRRRGEERRRAVPRLDPHRLGEAAGRRQHVWGAAARAGSARARAPRPGSRAAGRPAPPQRALGAGGDPRARQDDRRRAVGEPGRARAPASQTKLPSASRRSAVPASRQRSRSSSVRAAQRRPRGRRRPGRRAAARRRRVPARRAYERREPFATSAAARRSAASPSRSVAVSSKATSGPASPSSSASGWTFPPSSYGGSSSRARVRRPAGGALEHGQRGLRCQRDGVLVRVGPAEPGEHQLRVEQRGAVVGGWSASRRLR